MRINGWLHKRAPRTASRYRHLNQEICGPSQRRRPSWPGRRLERRPWCKLERVDGWKSCKAALNHDVGSNRIDTSVSACSNEGSIARHSNQYAKNIRTGVDAASAAGVGASTGSVSASLLLDLTLYSIALEAMLSSSLLKLSETKSTSRSTARALGQALAREARSKIRSGLSGTLPCPRTHVLARCTALLLFSVSCGVSPQIHEALSRS